MAVTTSFQYIKMRIYHLKGRHNKTIFKLSFYFFRAKYQKISWSQPNAIFC